MIKRTIAVANDPVHLNTEDNQLILLSQELEVGVVGRIPCEDVGVVVVEQPQTTYAHAALVRLIEFGAAVVICNEKHLPVGLLLPTANHTELVWRLREQIAMKRPLRKRLWQQLVVAKIRGQAMNLEPESRPRRRLLQLAREVKSGDSANAEGQAARIYWQHWLGDARFRRDTDGDDPLNSMLNYGYAIVRAAIARALVSAGLQPALGLHHRNRSNAFCLADDLLEVFRPLVDRTARNLHRDGCALLDKETKKKLLELLTATIRMGDQRGPLLVALPRMVASLVRCMQGEESKLLLPDVRFDQE